MSKGFFSGISPRPRFSLQNREWGSVELAARYSFIDLNDKDIKGGKEENFTLGLNWYLSPNSRFMFNYIRANVEDRAEPQIDDGSADIYQARFQINF